MKRLNLIWIAALISLPAFAQSRPNPECEALKKQIDAIYDDPRAEQCDGSEEGECAAFWDQLDSLFDKYDELGCEAPEDEGGEEGGNQFRF